MDDIIASTAGATLAESGSSTRKIWKFGNSKITRIEAVFEADQAF
jgi:hypothetical protein